MTEPKTSLVVSSNPSKDPNPAPSDDPKPEHWVNKAGTAFVNPWKSWRPHSFMDKLGVNDLFFGVFLNYINLVCLADSNRNEISFTAKGYRKLDTHTETNLGSKD